MNVKIKKFHPDARIPEKAYDKDFCYDVYAVSEKEILPAFAKKAIFSNKSDTISKNSLWEHICLLQ